MTALLGSLGPEAHWQVPDILQTCQQVGRFRENKSKTPAVVSSAATIPHVAEVLPRDCPLPICLSTFWGCAMIFKRTLLSCHDKFIHRIQRVSRAGRRLLRTMVLPCVTWAGAFGWVEPQKLVNARQQTSRAIKGWIAQSATRRNVSASELEPDDHPPFARQKASLRSLA